MSDTAMMQVRCGKCDAALRVPPRPGGRLTCPRCKAQLVIPTTAEVQAALPDRFALALAPAPPVAESTRGEETRAVVRDMLQRRDEQRASPSLDDLCDDPDVEFG